MQLTAPSMFNPVEKLKELFKQQREMTLQTLLLPITPHPRKGEKACPGYCSITRSDAPSLYSSSIPTFFSWPGIDSSKCWLDTCRFQVI